MNIEQGLSFFKSQESEYNVKLGVKISNVIRKSLSWWVKASS